MGQHDMGCQVGLRISVARQAHGVATLGVSCQFLGRLSQFLTVGGWDHEAGPAGTDQSCCVALGKSCQDGPPGGHGIADLGRNHRVFDGGCEGDEEDICVGHQSTVGIGLEHGLQGHVGKLSPSNLIFDLVAAGAIAGEGEAKALVMPQLRCGFKDRVESLG